MPSLPISLYHHLLVLFLHFQKTRSRAQMFLSLCNLEKMKLAARLASRDDSPADLQLPSHQSSGLYSILYR
ncbi:hypothetical protein I3843_04G166100 [Carya illinoinensis]|nr:hypothetical protein I3843_04G166100 [Carya illinoinensis]